MADNHVGHAIVRRLAHTTLTVDMATSPVDMTVLLGVTV